MKFIKGWIVKDDDYYGCINDLYDYEKTLLAQVFKSNSINIFIYLTGEYLPNNCFNLNGGKRKAEKYFTDLGYHKLNQKQINLL